MLIFSLVVGICFCRGNKIVAVRPWATGLSGQLQKAFVTGNFLSDRTIIIFCLML